MIDLNSIPKSESDKLLSSWGYDLMWDYFTCITHAGFDNNLPVFEAATGSGRCVSLLSRFNPYIISGDYDFTSMPDVRKRVTDEYLNRVNFVRLNLEKIPFMDKSVKNIACINTLHEVQNPVLCLKEVIRVHNGSGRLLISDFNEEGYTVMDKLHRVKFGNLHPRGSITFNEVLEIVTGVYNRIELIKTVLNWGLVLSLKKT